MTTTPGAAGSATFNPAVIYLATEAFRAMGILDEVEPPTAAMAQEALTRANLLLKSWQALGIHVWTEEEAILFPQAGQSRYVLSDSTTDNVVDAYAYTQTTSTVSAAQGASSLTLSSVTGLISGLNIGVGLDSGVTQWTTINGAPVGSSVALATPLTGAASAGANVFAYAAANKITRPLKISTARRRTWAPAGSLNGPDDIDLWIMARKDYQTQANKFAPGVPSALFYAPKLGFGELFLWQVPSDASCAIPFTWSRPIADLLNTASTVDAPQEWLNPIMWNLALEMGPSYEVPPTKWDRILLMAGRGLDMVQSWDRESEDIQFGYSDDGR